MRRVRGGVLCAALAIGAALPRPGVAQIVITLVNDQGATAPCAGLGVSEYCAEQFEHEGFVRVGDVGVSGLTLGQGDADGTVSAAAPGSPAAQALTAGDVIVAVDGKPVRPSPGAAAAQRLFGKKGDKVKLGLLRAGAPVDLVLTRAPVAEPPGPPSNNPMFGFHDLIDWRGKYIPCMGAGPAGFMAINICTSHFKPFGYVPVGDAGDVGIRLDLDTPDAAVVQAVEPGSPAAKAGVQPGDVIRTIDGKPVVSTRREVAAKLLFGKVGESRRVTVRRDGREITVALMLAAKSRQ